MSALKLFELRFNHSRIHSNYGFLTGICLCFCRLFLFSCCSRLLLSCSLILTFWFLSLWLWRVFHLDLGRLVLWSFLALNFHWCLRSIVLVITFFHFLLLVLLLDNFHVLLVCDLLFMDRLLVPSKAHFILINTLVLVTIHVHVIHLLLLDGSKVLRRSTESQLLVLDLSLLKFLLVPGNSQIHELEVFSLLVLVLLVRGAIGHAALQNLDLLRCLLFFLAHLIDACNQIHVVLHQTRVVLTVLLQVARELLAVVSD